MQEGRRSVALVATLALVALASPGSAQDDSLGPGDLVLVDIDDDVALSSLEGVSLRFRDLEMRADRALFWTSSRPLPELGDEDLLRVGPRVPPPPGLEPAPSSLDLLPPGVRRILPHLREIYLEGNVLWRRGDDAVIFADRLYYDFVEERGVIGRGRVIAEATRERQARPGRPARQDRVYSLQMRAEEIRMRGLDGLDVIEGEFSTCTFGEPHYHVHSDRTSIDFEADEEDPSSIGTIWVSSEGNHLDVGDTTILPLPGFSFSADAEEGLPIKRARVGHSSKLGAFLQTEWAWNIRDAGRSLHDALGLKEDFEGQFELNADLMSRRGPALGPGLQYESEGRYFGEIGTYFLRDAADEDRSRLPRPEVGGEGDPFRFDVDQPFRGRAFTRNRFFLGGPWSLDLESHWFGDRSFQREFFERENKTAKEPESYVHLVRRSGTTRSRLLYRNRLNDFDTQLDALPAASFDQVAFPVFGLGDDGPTLLLDQFHEAGNFRLHPADDLDLPSARVWRSDSLVELSSAIDLGPIGLRPFANGRFTAVDENIDREHSLGRTAAQAGARAQLPFHRDYDVFSSAFSIDGLRHIVILDAGYENTWEVNKGPEEFQQLDAVDGVDELETYLVGVRQRFQTWRGNAVQTFLQLDLEMPLFPREDRDNPLRVDTNGEPTGRVDGPLRFDMIYLPGFTFPWLEGTRLFAEGEWDTTDRQLDILNTGVAVRPRPDLWTSLSYRNARGRSRVATFGADWRLTEKWSLAALIQHDLRQNDVLEQRLSLRRHGHDFIVELEFERDEGEDNTSFSLNLRPIFFRPKAGDRGDYNRGANPGLDEFDVW